MLVTKKDFNVKRACANKKHTQLAIFYLIKNVNTLIELNAFV